MALAIGLTGMDRETEINLRTMIKALATRGGRHWELTPESRSDYVFVDMDSMYGPMSWIRLHGQGKKVIGISSSPRIQSDLRLGRPFTSDSVRELLEDIDPEAIAKNAGATPATTELPASAPAAEAPAISAASDHAAPANAGDAMALPSAAGAVPSGATPAPEPQDLLPEERPAVADAETAAPREPQAEPEPIPPPAPPPPAPAPTPTPAASAPPDAADPLAWLHPAGQARRCRFRHAGAAELYVDFGAEAYFGPQQLKPLAPAFAADATHVPEPLDDAGWERDTAGLGAPQPLARLRWFAALQAGHGALLSGHDPDGTYRLARWPQTEREFPRHFRIATAMMKAPTTLPALAQASGAPLDEVVDFVNANLATGYAEFVPPAPPPADAPPSRPGGLFGRLRGGR